MNLLDMFTFRCGNCFIRKQNRFIIIPTIYFEDDVNNYKTRTIKTSLCLECVNRIYLYIEEYGSYISLHDLAFKTLTNQETEYITNDLFKKYFTFKLMSKYIDYSCAPVKEIKKWLKIHGIKGYSKMNRGQLIKLIESNL